MKSDSGRLRPGFSISPPVNVTLFQADWANSGPVIARPSIITSAKPPAMASPGCAACGLHPLAHESHQEDVYAALPLFQPISRPRTINPISAAVLVNVKVF